MEEFTLDFFGEKASIKKPTDLSFLRDQIIKNSILMKKILKILLSIILKKIKKNILKMMKIFLTF